MVPMAIHSWSWPVPDKGNSSQRHKFSKAEDELLRKLVEKYGETNWTVVAAHMKTRTPRQCRERFKNYLSTKIRNDPWTIEEETLLEEKVKELGPRWAKIALFFESRSDVNVKNHWTALLNRQMREKQCALLKEKNSSNEPINNNQKFPVPEIFVPEITTEFANSINDNQQSPQWGESEEFSASSISNFIGDSMVEFFFE